jgi:hypothetical protein
MSGSSALDMLALGFTLGVVAAVAWFYGRESLARLLGIRRTTPEERLLRACQFDETQCDRLIAEELTRNPTLPRDEAAARALAARRRDNR